MRRNGADLPTASTTILTTESTNAREMITTGNKAITIATITLKTTTATAG